MTDFPLCALTLPEPAAAAAWQAWRAALDIDALPYESQQLIPTLAGRLPKWLEGDASAARFQGIVKMVWSRNQVRLRRAAELRQKLLELSGGPVLIAGPLAWSLVTRDDGAIRFIPYLTILIPRQHVSKAVSALCADGWELAGELPEGEAFDWLCYLGFTKGDDTLHLHWRLFPTPPGQAAACELECLERARTAVWNQHTFCVLSAEADLLHRLTSRPHWDPVPWQADVLMMPFDAVNWGRFRALALRFTPDAVGRLTELRRDFQLPVPEIAQPHRLRFVELIRRLSERGRLLWKS